MLVTGGNRTREPLIQSPGLSLFGHRGCLKVRHPNRADRRYPELAYGDSTDMSYQLNTELAYEFPALSTVHYLCDTVEGYTQYSTILL